MKEPLIDFETAKLAKEQGFNELVRDYFIVDGDKIIEDNGDGDCEFIWLNHNKYKNYYSRPTVAFYQKWLNRDKKYVPPIINPDVKQTYLILDRRTGYHKIGRSKDPLQREKTLQAEQPDYVLVATTLVDVEKELHRKYKHLRMRGEWFNLSTIDVLDIKNLYF